MFSKIKILLLSCFIFCPIFMFSQEKEKEFFKLGNFEKYVKYISSDRMKGRSFGSEGEKLNIVAEYIRDQVASLKLSPKDGQYFQEIKITSSKADLKKSYIEVLNGKSKSLFKSDSVVSFYNSVNVADLSGEVVCAGFGTTKKENGTDGFSGLDLQDKIVLISTGYPENLEKENTYQWDLTDEMNKVEKLFKRGAKGALIADIPIQKTRMFFSTIYRRSNESRFFLSEKIANTEMKDVFFISRETADKIVGKTGGFRNLLIENSAAGNKGAVQLKASSIKIKVKKELTYYEGKNIVGFVQGSDPQLKKECVVFTAHYDHIGKDKKGNVYNGADDNASGVAALLELARVFQELEHKPARSILFLWSTAEEIGLLGSESYTQNPLFPLQKTVACINLDMIGRVYEIRDSVWKSSPKLVKDFNGIYTLTSPFCPELASLTDSACIKLGLIPDHSLPDMFLRSSDHYNFHNNNIPILNLSTGYHADYHKITDDDDKINFKKMNRVANLCYEVGIKIANMKSHLKIVNH